MYSEIVQQLLKKKKIKIGDKIRVTKAKATYEGILMPRIELGDTSSIVVKLDNGYNAGVKFEKNMKIKLLERGKPIKFHAAGVRVKTDSSKPTVVVLGCGGTIASRVEYKTGAVFPAFSPGDLLLSFPELKDIANIRGRKLFDLFSEDMTAKHWQIVAREVASEINKKADGVILMHGTDTLHYTAAALSFMLQNLPVPVVLVGSQRSSDRGSSDNAMNLICSTLLAAKGNMAEVVVCMHANMADDFCYAHPGTKVRKMHTSRRDTFRSINVLPYAKVWYQQRSIEYLRNDFRQRSKGRVKVDDKINGNVALVYSYPGIKPEFIDSLASFNGVVIAGTGLGHVPTNPNDDRLARSIIPNLKDLINSGIPIVIAPQTIYGRLQMDVYSAGRVLNKIGVIGHNCDWTPETALVKLMWVLGHTKHMNKIKEMMLKNYAGEISERTDTRAFLI